MSAIAIRNLWKEYPGRRVLERINLAVAAGQFVAIVGASGCGKSTFLRLPLSQEKPTRGTILLDGERLPDDPGPDRGVVFQRYSVFPHLTAIKNVLLGLEIAAAPLTGKLFGVARRRAIREAQGCLEAVGLASAKRALPGRALGRHAAAPRHRPGAGAKAQGAAARRALRRARSRHARRHARVHPQALAGDGDDRLHGDARH